MGTLQTFFRAVVMIITIGILAKAWYHYGPNTDELQMMGSRVFQIAVQAWDDYWRTPPQNTPLVGANSADALATQNGPAPFMPPAIEPPPIHTSAAPTTGPVHFAGGALPPSAPALSSLPGTPDADPASPALVPMDAPVLSEPVLSDAVAQLQQQLAGLGVRDQELKPWGGSGNLYRFTCSAPWANSPSFTRHFEAVAESPEVAVQRVAADIHEWQRGQRQ